MNLSAVYHRSNDNYCYELDEDTLIINIQTGYDVERVELLYSDPFAGGILGGNWQIEPEKQEFKQLKYLENHKFWSIEIKPPYKRLKYFFRLSNGGEEYYYFEDGFFKAEQLQDKDLQCFIKPWMNPADINVVPSWVEDTIWYQIFPDRFCDGDESNNPWWVKKWGEQPIKNENSYGGDLQGIIDKLDYLADLGINGIYLTPIFSAKSIHKYDTLDYYTIDPMFGDDEKFKELVQKAHAKGIRIMLDGVFNHCSDEHPFWLDVLKNGKESKYFNWFMINEWPIKPCKNTRDKQYYSFAFEKNMPKLNTNNPDVIDYICDVCCYWVDKYDIDGWRLDVANEISHKLCKELRIKLKSIKPDIFILGEIWHDAMEWLRGDEYDSVMSYPLKAAIDDFYFLNGKNSLDFEHRINACYTRYMQQTNQIIFNLLDSHDTQRLINHLNFDYDKFIQQFTILMSMPGSPCMFYGSEIALAGEHDPDCRQCMDFEAVENSEIYPIIKKLIHLRKSEKALRSGDLRFIHDSELQIINYERNDEIGVLINTSDKEININGYKTIFKYKCKNNILNSQGLVIYKK